MFYSELANTLGLQHFIINDVEYPQSFPLFLPKNKSIVVQKFTRKNLSDCFEALIATMFLNYNTLSPIFEFLLENTNAFL